MEVDVVIVRVEVTVWLGVGVTVVELKVTEGPAGDIVVAKPTFPEKSFKLVMLTDAVAEKPALTVILPGLTPNAKSGVVLVEKVAA